MKSLSERISDREPFSTLYDIEDSLPDSLITHDPVSHQVPLHALLGLHNREERKQAIKSIKSKNKRFGIDHKLSDDEILLLPVTTQVQRLRFFWDAKHFGKRLEFPHFPFKTFRFSLPHTLLALYRADVFADSRPLDDGEINSLEMAGLPIVAMIEDIADYLNEDKETKLQDPQSVSAFCLVWHDFLDDFHKWAELGAEAQTTLSRAVFAFASALGNPAILSAAVELCPGLRPFFASMETDAYELNADDNEVALTVSVSNKEAYDGLYTLCLGDDLTEESARAALVPLNLIGDLKAVTMMLASLIARPQVPLRNAVWLMAALAEKLKLLPAVSSELVNLYSAYNKLLTVFESPEYREAAKMILGDIARLASQWHARVYCADNARLMASYEAMVATREAITVSSEDFLARYEAYAEKLQEIQAANGKLSAASLTEMASAQDKLKSLEAARDQSISDLIAARGSLFSALFPFSEEPGDDLAWQSFLISHADGLDHFQRYCSEPRPVPVAEHIEAFIAGEPTLPDGGDEGCGDGDNLDPVPIPKAPAPAVNRNILGSAVHKAIKTAYESVDLEPVPAFADTKGLSKASVRHSKVVIQDGAPPADVAKELSAETLEPDTVDAHAPSPVEADATPDPLPDAELASVPVQPASLPCVKVIEEADLTEPDEALALIFWGLVKDGFYGAAKQLSLAYPGHGIPDCALMDLVCFGQELVFPHGHIANALGEIVTQFDVSHCTAAVPDADHSSINLLVVASAIRSGLIAPNSGVSSLLALDLSMGPGWETLHAIAQRVARDAPQMHGVISSPDSLHKQQVLRDIEQRRVLLADEIQNWLDAGTRSTLTYKAASSIWHYWVGNPEGLVHRLLKPITTLTQGLGKDKEWVALLELMHNHVEVDEHVQETDKQLRGAKYGSSSRFGNIEAAALDSIRRRCAEAANLAQRWLELDTPRKRSDYSERLISDLDRFLSENREAVFREIDRAAESDLPSMVAAAHCLHRAASALYMLFEASGGPSSAEKSPQLALNLELLRIPGFHLDGTYRVEKDEMAIDSPRPQAVEPSIDRLIREGDFFGAQLLCNELPMGHPTRERTQAALLEARVAVQAHHEALMLNIESHFRNGLLGDSGRDNLVAEMADIEQQFEESARPDLLRARMDAIKESLRVCSEGRVAAIRKRKDALGLADDSPYATALEKLITSSDLLTAEEYIDNLERGAEPPSSEGQDIPALAFQYFLEQVEPHLETFAEDLDAGTVHADLVDQGFSPESVESAKELVTAWTRLKHLGKSNKLEVDALRKFFQQLGFNLSSSTPVRKVESTAVFSEFQLSVEPLTDRRICPIPEFGSDAVGRYRVIFVNAKQDEIEPTDIPKSKPGTFTPTIVLFPRQMSSDGREDLFDLGNSQRWIVIDETLLFHLALVPQGRLRTLFSAALPYTHADPYKSKSGFVAPEMFFGRAVEYEQIVSPRGTSTVYGGRQLGKTALIKEIERQVHNKNEGRIVKWIDVLGDGIGRSKPPSALFDLICRELFAFDVVQTDPDKFKSSDDKQVTRLMGEIETWVERHPDRRLILLLDETDDCLREDASADYPVTRKLKLLFDKTDGAFKAVFVGLHNVRRASVAPNNPIVHLGAVEIGPLYLNGEYKQAFELVRAPFAALGYKFDSDELIMRIIAACNYYPVLINHFCSKLLARARQDRSVRFPKVISDKMVSNVYETSGLRGEIRYYFQMTLDLDPRYALIALWLALEHLTKRVSATEGATTKALYEGVKSWWDTGFAGTSQAQFEALLEELCGLGVLRKAEKGGYIFRNVNVMNLLGSQQEIEDRMLAFDSTHEVLPGFDRNTSRNTLKRNVRDPERSPLTVSQEQALTAPANGVHVIIGPTLNGLAEAPATLETLAGAAKTETFDGKTLTDFEKALVAFRGKARQGVYLFVVGPQKAWTMEWVILARKLLDSRSSTVSHVKAVFMADSEKAWPLITSGHFNQLQDSEVISLDRWHDSFLKIWLEDIQMPADQPHRIAVRNATDGRHTLLRMLAADLTSSSKLLDRCEAFVSGTLTADKADTLLKGLGVSNKAALDALNVLAAFSGEPEKVILDALKEELDGLEPEHVLAWAKLFYLVKPEQDQSLRVTEFVQSLLDLIRE